MRRGSTFLSLATALLITLGIADTRANARETKNTVKTVTIVFKPNHNQAFTDEAYATVDPNSAQFHQYLSTSQVADRYGRSAAQLKQFQAFFNRYQLKTSVYAGNLSMRVMGNYSHLKKAFQAKAASNAYQKKHIQGTIYRLPKALAEQTIAVIGMNVNRPKSKTDGKAKSRSHQIQAKVTQPLDNSTVRPNTSLAQQDFSKKYGSLKYANQYGLNQLYQQGLSGKGQRVGLIMTKDFRIRDVKLYLQKDGSNADTSRIHRYYTVDGRKRVQKYNQYTNAVKEAYQEESSLDVEQAASVAPDAQIDTYIGESIDSATDRPTIYFNTFAAAIAANRDRQISTSFMTGTEKAGFNDNTVSVTPKQYETASDVIYRQAAVQGITIFDASGDRGPYETQKSTQEAALGKSGFVTQIGGTTIPYQKVTHDKLVNVTKERAWGDTYSLAKQFLIHGVFLGGGGGFSKLHATPRFQQGYPGVNTYHAFTMLKWNDKKHQWGVNPHPKLISGRATGRNYPDFSSDSDMQTGFATYLSTTSKKTKRTTGKWFLSGGTSYAAPQAAAALAVVNSGLNQPIGFMNPQIYQFAEGPSSPFTTLNDASINNTNLYYTGQPGKPYNQATGLGIVNYPKLLDSFKAQDK
ncbi:protease pro-enzyme activation domain-containing protein [Lentilactobacillus raoultii]|uniref:Protease pro-enzyme activation domain-containing protein n=1 Tax=Lentilactobacillus raoultii TaxID=1987503 RepID=A0ABW3PIK9_9LACO|nr:protease pro-enzyme activation domain-containing protein [Lentilactobacillus raoultii]